MHLGDEFVHPGQLLRCCLDDEVDAFADQIELGVGDQHSDLNQDIFIQGEARHFAIDPDQMGEFGGHGWKFRGLALMCVNSG